MELIMPAARETKIIDGVTHYHCCVCKEFLTAEKFSPSTANADGLRGTCRDCRNLQKRRNRRRNNYKKRFK